MREPDFDLAVGHLAPRGRMVLMAGRDARPPFPVGPFYVKDCSLYGFAMFNATPEEQREAAEAISGWMVAKKLLPNIDRVMPLSQAAMASPPSGREHDWQGRHTFWKNCLDAFVVNPNT